ncbi:hypothetical protein predicted by Glimmer/Critica [Acetobacter senegalensis]|uniref:Uncharacterized protein n=1 Tax=Acetobacter senegalensis TaxID=446692 RepID=A0A0U5BCX2_9PROT|nr:hypothetical protein [Acetobacter senegalensis]CEF42387.1 hypothetical protein predicted by Glimmer/Critica [Acetobacter senegalensis]
MTLTQSDRAHGVIQDVYADWGQLPPDTAALQTAGTALYNLSYAWTTTIQNQTADQLAAEAAVYQPIAGTASYGQIIEIFPCPLIRPRPCSQVL